MFSSTDNTDINGPVPIEFQDIVSLFPDHNQVSINWYNADDYISPHSDCTVGLIPDSSIVVISLYEDINESRNMVFKHKEDKQNKFEVELTHGSILSMSYELNEKYKHSVPKGKCKRISITLRKFIDHS